MEKSNKIYIGVYSYSERELSQIIRRKMITKSCKNKKKYDRKKNKNSSDYFFEYLTAKSIFKM